MSETKNNLNNKNDNVSDSNFLVKNINFEGPFSLLLELIRKKKLLINDVSLSNITDEYILFIKENEMELKEASNFIIIAATLMLIKSRSLLPKISLDEDEIDDIEELQKKLKFLREIKNISKKIKNIFSKNILIKKIYKKKVEVKFRPHENITLKNILISLDKILIRSPFKEHVPEKKVKKTLSLKEVINTIHEKINRFLKLNFHELVLGGNKKDVSVSFLAILELFKNQKIDLKQEERFGNIVVKHKISNINN